MPRNSRARLKAQRARLYEEQRCLCFWCSRRCVLPEDMPFPERKPEHMATLDHVDDKFSPLRGTLAGQRRHVMACWKCNQRRSIESMRQNPEEQRRRSGAGHQKKLARSLSEARPVPNNTSARAEIA